jgi:hypothetical protein
MNRSATKILMAQLYVMGGRMMLGKVISRVELARRPVEVELALLDVVFQPFVLHVEGFRSFEPNLRFEDAVSVGIVSL